MKKKKTPKAKSTPATKKEPRIMDTLVLSASQQVTFSVSYTDKKGNPAKVEGLPVWASSDEALLTVEAAADGMSALAVAVGGLTPPDTTVQVSVTADADLGEGVTAIVGVGNVAIVAGEAVAANLSAGAPEEQP